MAAERQEVRAKISLEAEVQRTLILLDDSDHFLSGPRKSCAGRLLRRSVGLGVGRRESGVGGSLHLESTLSPPRTSSSSRMICLSCSASDGERGWSSSLRVGLVSWPISRALQNQRYFGGVESEILSVRPITFWLNLEYGNEARRCLQWLEFSHGKPLCLHWIVQTNTKNWHAIYTISCVQPGSLIPITRVKNWVTVATIVHSMHNAVEALHVRRLQGRTRARRRNVKQHEARTFWNIKPTCCFSVEYCSPMTPIKMLRTKTEKKETPAYISSSSRGSSGGRPGSPCVMNVEKPSKKVSGQSWVGCSCTVYIACVKAQKPTRVKLKAGIRPEASCLIGSKA